VLPVRMVCKKIIDPHLVGPVVEYGPRW
jgi:hypothetical protein